MADWEGGVQEAVILLCPHSRTDAVGFFETNQEPPPPTLQMRNSKDKHVLEGVWGVGMRYWGPPSGTKGQQWRMASLLVGS